MKSTTTLLFFLLLLSGCKKEGGSSQYYFKATINGEAIQWTCKKSGGGDYGRLSNPWRKPAIFQLLAG